MEKIKKLISKIRKNKLLQIEIIVVIICIIVGTLLHFTYQISEENKFVGSFSAVNESVWEHLKLTFYPMLITAIIEYFFVKDIANNYIEAKTIGIFTAISFVVVAFFTYTGIIGSHILIIDILIFILSIVLGERVAYNLMKREDESTLQSKILAGVITVFLLLCFVLCTYYTPEVNLFRDLSTGEYGINKK